MDRADGLSFGEAMRQHPDLVPAHLQEMALLHLRVHSHPGTQLAALKARLAANIRRTDILSETRQHALLSALAAMPDGDRLCHGDFHPMNILGPLGRQVLVDWLDACAGHPAADVCRSYILMKPRAPDIASAYVDVYASVSGESRDRILAWLPFVAAARLAEGVPDEVAGLTDMVEAGLSRLRD